MPGSASGRGSAKGRVAQLLTDQAEAHEASVLNRSGDILLVDVRLRRASGKVARYHLRIDAGDVEPEVREAKPERLPTYCPNRHVNDEGVFCLSFPSEDPLPVVDAASAAAWWARLLKYLSLQETTTRLRRWPSRHEWAHGVAAMYQQRAEVCAAALGAQFVKALAQRRLTARRRGKGSDFLQVYDGARRLYAVWEEPRRVATLRQRCLCGSGRALVTCADHAARAAELPFALLAWEKAERRFWRFAQGRTCCGTLDDCPLTAAKTQAAQPPPIAAQAA